MRRAVLIISLLLAALIFIFVFNGYIWPNKIAAKKYPVRGIDVSGHQGEIDWTLVGKSDIKFVFIKATEGKTFKDSYFTSNWSNSSKAGLLKGAYHYFKTTSSGTEQARNFIDTVPVEKWSLPPVIDIEESGTDKLAFKKELNDFAKEIEVHYQQKPILYVVYPTYEEYIKGDFEGYQIWVRDVIKPARLSDNREWIFWQYCNRGKVEGISTFVDLNVFNGSEEDLKKILSEA